jgi:hypothetical protein
MKLFAKLLVYQKGLYASSQKYSEKFLAEYPQAVWIS